MAAEDEGRTEEATEHKLREARDKGQVAKSQDFSAAVIAVCGTLAVWVLGSWCRENIAVCLHRFVFDELSNEAIPHDKEIVPYLILGLQYVFYIVAPIMLLILVVSIAINIYQVGLHISTESLKLNFDKLNPVKGLQNLFSMQKIVMLGQNILKIAFAFAVAFPALAAAYTEAGMLSFLSPMAAATYCARGAIEVALRVSIALLVLSLFDFWYQRHKFAEQMKMTKEEVKDEMRSQEGDPQVKSKRRQKQMEMARNRMMKEIPDADVVVRNPTHYAVALKYAVDMAAPMVVAKGKNKIALKILELAREANVPTWQDPWLARELYKIELNDVIPPELFNAVVGIFAHVMSKEKIAEIQRAQAEAAA